MATLIINGGEIEVTPCCPFCNAPVKRAELRVEDFGREGRPCYKPVACCSWDDDRDDDAGYFTDERMAKYWESYIRAGVQDGATINLARPVEQGARRAIGS